MDKQVDEIAAHELYIYAVNTGDLYRRTTTPTIANLKRKVARGDYDRGKAMVAWRHVADAAARAYTQEFRCDGPNGSFGPFDKPTRLAVAADLFEYYQEDVESELKDA